MTKKQNGYTTEMQRDYGCTSKREYTTYAAANRAARFTRNSGVGYVEPYHCKYCGRFHVGGRPYEVVRMLANQKRQAYEPTIESSLQDCGIEPSKFGCRLVN